MKTTLMEQAGRWTASLRADSLSTAQQEQLQAMALYNLAVALAGQLPDDALQSSMRSLYSTPGDIRVVGTTARLSIDDATATHALLAIAAGLTDTHPRTVGHIGCVVVPPLMTLAYDLQSSRDDVVAALWAAFDLPPKLGGGQAAQLSTRRGFRGTPVFSIFGAAAACARLLRLDEERCANAIGIAANFASGLTQCFAEGTSESQVQTIQAARAGLHAARLAAIGVKAARLSLEGASGFYQAYAGWVPPSLDFQSWSLDALVIKPFPGCAINQVPVLLLQRMMQQTALRAQDIDAIDVHLHPDDAAYPGVASNGPFIGRMGAIMSTAFMMGVVAHEGRLALQDFRDRYGHDEVHTWSQRVKVIEDGALSPFACRVRVTMKTGAVLEEQSTASDELVLDLPRMRVLCPQILNSTASSDQQARSSLLVDAVRGFFEGGQNAREMIDAVCG